MPLLERVISIVAPHQCLGCSKEGLLLCKACQEQSLEHLPSRCYRCQVLTSDSAVCERCRRRTGLKHVWVCTSYDGVAKQLLHEYKFAYARAGVKPIATVMYEKLPYITADIAIAAVPTETRRIRQRGYDHARLIARELARLSGRDYLDPMTRLTHTRQVGAGREERFRQLEDAFMVKRAGQVKGRNVVLVDDVVTTGATLESAAAELKKAGALRVYAIVFAQKR